ncbi:adaptin N terminal region-domain-containing protein [Radiomyces spectabilis]|uniref:adaptin N terminal region-domain-containing protein n=1 Tax=Radiomyces spectabilis TaxID=64574 RepID=UPI00221F8663|nr:adaptin N terminal region-domain-containing protein [Radiomyces spectabilis]KAI8391211.1 adaptin N terminal region-domain-containing protein [Radiomyces spectabilis]
MSYGKRDDDTGEVGLFYHLDKTVVLQEARAFNDTPISARKCRLLLTKIIYLLYLGEPFATKEATDLFFNVIKLFQSKDTSLRQMMYLVIKELSKTAEDVIMVTQSLIKDIQSKQETIYRANAIRALCLITDPSMIQGIERILKASIVDKTPSVSSAALVSSYHLYGVAKDIVRRWSNEVQEAVHAKSSSGFASAASSYMSSFGGAADKSNVVISASNITQYHALGLLYQIRQHDRMAVAKLVQAFAGGRSGGILGGGGSPLKNPAAVCLLIRYACKVMEDDPSATRRMYELLEGFLRHRSDMVNLEAARAICEIPDMSSKELYPAISVLQLFLSSPKPTLRFAAIRILNKLAQSKPAVVSPCNLDIENLITDQNRSVATFAITTLLKTGNEASVDRLMKQISGFMGEISDEFKVIVVDAIRSLCLKFPAKQVVMLTFLSGVLRDEGGYDFKKAVVEAIFDMIKFIPESKDTALSYLCEFIEDCEFTKLSVRILHVLGVEGPKTTTPTKFIRYIYNRVILENSIVRAAAVSALAKFGVNVEDPLVKKSVHVLLTRCLDDTDDEVRDRATLYLTFMDHTDLAKRFVKDDATFALPTLEHQLVEYLNNPLGNDQEFDLQNIPVISKAQEEEERRRLRTQDITAGPTLATPSTAQPGTPATPSTPGAPAAGVSSLDQQAMYAEKLSAIPEFATFGPLFKSSSKPVELTESETEYVVHCVKHTYLNHIVFQFNCTNTLNDQLLESVEMLMQPEIDDCGLVQVASIAAEKLEYNVTGVLYLAFQKEQADEFPVVSFTNTLKFVVKDCDPTTGEPDPEGYEDEYQVEDVEVLTSDYIRPTYISSFAEEWEPLAENEAIETFALDKEKAPSLKAACVAIMDLLGMQALEDTALPKSSNVHTLLLAGIFVGGSKVLARCRMTFSNTTGVAFELAVRSDDTVISQIVLSAIA